MSLPPYIIEKSLSNRADSYRNFVRKGQPAPTPSLNDQAIAASRRLPTLPQPPPYVSTPEVGTYDWYVRQKVAEVKTGETAPYITPPVFAVFINNDTSVNEGSTVNFVLSTNLPDRSVIYWQTISNHNITTNRFSDGVLSGVTTTYNNLATIPRTVSWDEQTSPGTQFALIVDITPSNGEQPIKYAATSRYVLINDTSIEPTYQIQTVPTVVYEGAGSVGFNILATGLQDGSVLAWYISGADVTSTDFTDNTLSGHITVYNNSANISKFASINSTPNDDRNFTLYLKRYTSQETPVAVSDIVTIKSPEYTFTSTVTSLYEGSQPGIFNIATVGVSDGTTLYWNTSSVNSSQMPAASAFDDNTLSGTAVVYNDVATVTRRAQANNTLDESVSFYLQLFRTEPLNYVVATTDSVSILDITPRYSISQTTQILNEGQSVTFTLTALNLADETELYWTTDGTADGDRFTDVTNNGSVTMNLIHGTLVGTTLVGVCTGAITRVVRTNFNQQDSASFTLRVHTDSIYGPTVISSNEVQIVDITPNIVVSTDYTSILRGGNITYNISTTGVNSGTALYWSSTGTNVIADYNDGGTGTVVVTNNTATLTRSTFFTLSAPWYNTIFIRTAAGTSTPVVATTPLLSSLTPVFESCIPDNVIVYEPGSDLTPSSTTFTLRTQNVADGTVVYWTTEGTATINIPGLQAKDRFTDNALSGTCTIINNTALITRSLRANSVLNDSASFNLRINAFSTTGPLLVRSNDVNIVNISTRTFDLTQDSYTINEGDSVVYNLTVTNVEPGDVYYWTTDGTATSDRFTDNVDNGVVSLSIADGIGTATIIRTVKVNQTSGDAATFTLRIRSDSAAGPILKSADSVLIRDATPTYTIAQSTFSINEGQSVVYTITATEIGNGTPLYWTTDGTALADRFTDNTTSGTVIMLSATDFSTCTGTITRSTTTNYVTADSANFTLRLRTGSTAGPIVADASQVTIRDTSPLVSINASTDTLLRSNNITYNISTTGISNGTPLYWTAFGTNALSEFTDGGSGTIVVTNSAATLTRSSVFTLSVPYITGIVIRPIPVITGPVIATSQAAISPTPVFSSIVPDVNAVYETDSGFNPTSVTFTITTSNVANGTIVYWSTVGTALADRFSDNTLSGTVTIFNNTATITRAIGVVGLHDDDAIFALRLNAFSVNGPQLIQSSDVTIIRKPAPFWRNITSAAGKTVTGFTIEMNPPQTLEIHWPDNTITTVSDNATAPPKTFI